MTEPSDRTLWIFNHYAAAPDQGAGTRHFDLARELVKSGWRVTIFAAGFSHFTGREERLRGLRISRRQSYDGVEFVWLRTTPYRGNDAWRILNMLTYFLAAIATQLRHGRPSHVIGSTVHPLGALAGLVAARWHRARFFFEIRDLWPQTLIDLGAMSESGLPARLLRRLERYLAEQAAAVIALLPGIAEYLRERRVRTRDVVHIPNGVDISRSGSGATDGEAATQQLEAIRTARRAGCFVAVYAGAHGPANGLDTVLDAAELLQRRGAEQIRLVLMGDGPEKPRLADRSRSLGLRNLELLPPVPKAAVWAVLSEADACLLHVTRSPVHRFGTSFNKLFDYMASGSPIVFACDAPDDPVTLAGAGLAAAPDDPVALADAIDALRAMPVAQQRRLGANGRRHVEQHHDVAVLARRLEAVLTR